MTKTRYPKCPYCGTTYRTQSSFDYALVELATKSWVTERKVKCPGCEAEYLITLTLMYYGKRIKGGEHGKMEREEESGEGGDQE